MFILVQSEEEYFLVWKAEPLTIQNDKDKWKKIDQKGKKWQHIGPLRCHASLDYAIYNQFYSINILVIL